MNRIFKYKTNRGKVDFFLVLMVFMFTVSPFFLLAKLNLLFAFIVLAIIFFKRGYRIERKVIFLVLIAIILISVQGFLWGFNLLTLFTYTAFAILTPYFLFRIIGINVFNYLVRIIYISAFYTLFIWFLQVMVPPFDSFLQDLKNYVYINYSWDRWARSLIFYTVANPEYKINIGFMDIYRNSGIYHEPGAFAYWLVFGIGLNTIIRKKYLNKKNLIMTIALITTFSTAGYLQLFVLVLFFIIKSRINLMVKAISVIIFIILSLNLYTTVGFLGFKISQHYTAQSSVQLEGAYTTGRFIRIRKALAVIEQSPLFGRGIITASAADDPYSKYDAGTATLGIIAHYGLILGFLYYLFLFRGINILIIHNKYSTSYAIFFLITLMMGGLSQNFIYDVITLQLFFLGLLQWKRSGKLKKDYTISSQNGRKNSMKQSREIPKNIGLFNEQ